jgi:GNAT superfamily N-acetyltransferase
LALSPPDPLAQESAAAAGVQARQAQISEASAADHACIQQLLTCCGQRVSAQEFQAQLEDPFYRPQQRLLARLHGRAIAHARIVPREICFGQTRVPICELAELAILPENQGYGCEAQLIDEAERAARRSGALLACARTSATQLFQQAGWVVGPRHSYSTIGPRELLSCIRQAPRRSLLPGDTPPAPDLTVRLWRRMEQDALTQLYQSQIANEYGAAHRSESYWQWLIARQAFDRIYVAIDGPQRLGLDEATNKIHGYAVLRESWIVECAAAHGRRDVFAHLLCRACDDALEHDWHPLRIEASPNHCLHALVASAGGRTYNHDADEGQAILVKLFDSDAYMRTVSAEFVSRAKSAGLRLPSELGVATDNGCRRLLVSRRGARLHGNTAGRASVSCSGNDWMRLLIGRVSAGELAEQDRLRASSRSALEMAKALFPRVPLWLSTWDSLPALSS